MIRKKVPEESICSENQLERQKINNCLLLKHSYTISISNNKPSKKNNMFWRVRLTSRIFQKSANL